MKKGLTILALLLVNQACSVFSPGEKKVEEMSGSMPDFFVFQDFKKTKGRSIASTNNEVEKPVAAFSNRKIYFLTLLSQYYELKHITRIDSPNIKVCPSFHTEVLDNKVLSKPMGKVFVDLAHTTYDFEGLLKKDAEYLSLYPELSLPLTFEALHPSVIDSLNVGNQKQFSEMLVKAYKIHLGKVYNELHDMCEKGQTDNFYVFENLVTFTKSHPDFKDNKSAIKSILKSSVFANMYILKSFKIKHALERNVASVQADFSAFEEEVVSRTDTFWVKNYLDELKNRRALKKF